MHKLFLARSRCRSARLVFASGAFPPGADGGKKSPELPAPAASDCRNNRAYMLYMPYMELLIVCAIAILLYFWLKVVVTREYAKRRVSDEAVIKAQTEFERRLETNIDLPDGIRGREAFIYWHLMSKWFASRHASSRHAATESNKIKSDWLDYMQLMDERAILRFLSLGTENEEKRKAYDEEAIEVSRKITMIEDGMAAAVGQEAVAQLEDARRRPHDEFDRLR
jgi:hypothetical protein